jgi:LysM repeat protein
MMMNVDKSPKNEEEFSLFATSQKKFHSKAALEYSFRIEEMFTTTPMNALFLRPPLSPPPPHATRISSQKRSSNATFRRTTTLCVTPRATASSSSSTSSTSSTTNNNSVVNKKKIIVKVQPQQTLSIVSKENGISIPDIVRLNGLGTRRTLQVGEELIVSDFEGNVGDADVGYKIIERAKMTTMMITSSTDEEKTTVEKEKEIVSSSSPSTTSPTDEKTTEEKEQNVKKILRLVPENAKEAIMRKIERLKVETTNKSDASTASLIQVVPRSVIASVPFTTSFGVGVGAAVLSMALVATNIGRDGKGKEEKEEEEEEKKEVGFEVESSGISSSSSSTRDSNSSNEEIEAVSVETKLVEKEVAEEVKVTTPLPTVEVVEEKEDVVEVGRSESSPAPLERLKGWMDERDAQENFESSIEEFKAKLAAAQDALIVLQDQLEQSKRKKNSQK